MNFGNFYPDALEALNIIFACAEPLLSLYRLFNNGNNNNAEEEDEMIAAVPHPLNDAEIDDANDFLENELEDLGKGENDPDGEDDPNGEDD